MAEYAIGVDLGGTNLRAAAMDSNGTLIHKVSVTTNLEAGRDTVVNDIVSAIEQVRNQTGSGDLAGIGIGVPGFVRMKEGVIARAPNMPGFDNFPFRDTVSQRLNTTVILENDANAAALGEHWAGAGRGVDNLVLLTLGTGIGGGIIIGGKVLHGNDGMAAELGHMTILPGGNVCGCGNDGCLEKHASATAVESMANLLVLGEGATSKRVYELAASGNQDARRIFESMGTALGLALGTLVNIFNFPLYLLSGGMLPAWEYFAPAMLDQVKRRSFTYRVTQTRIEPATLGNEAGLYGAAYLPFQNRQ